METAAILSGFGGQGLLFTGHVLAQAALLAGRAVSWMPSYGPEMRGGTASCSVIVADHPVGSPIVDRADIVVALTAPALERFRPLLAGDGLLIVNTSLGVAPPGDVELVALPCSTIAAGIGEDRLVSIVALGALVARRPVVDRDLIRRALADVIGERRSSLVAANVAALERGYEAALDVRLGATA